MARHEITNGQLLALRNEINKADAESIVFHFFQKEKVSRFYRLNSIQLNSVEKKIAELVTAHVKHADGKPCTELKPNTDMQPVPAVIKKKKWWWPLGKTTVTATAPPVMTEQYVFKSKLHETRYLDQINEFMTRVVTIDL